MELIQRQVHYTQEGKRTFDQFYVDEDYNVPDTKEDVKQIVQGKGNVKVEDLRRVDAPESEPVAFLFRGKRHGYCSYSHLVGNPGTELMSH